MIEIENGLIMPGIIEAHCHMGITEEKKGMEGDDCNETVDPVTPWLRAIDAINTMDAALKPHADSHAEYHHLYADLQIDLTGGEGWGYETAPGTEVEPYHSDIGQVDSPDAIFGTLGEGRFVLFFPGELHRPGVEMPDCSTVRKAVVKIKMEDKYHG